MGDYLKPIGEYLNTLQEKPGYGKSNQAEGKDEITQTLADTSHCPRSRELPGIMCFEGISADTHPRYYQYSIGRNTYCYTGNRRVGNSVFYCGRN